MDEQEIVDFLQWLSYNGGEAELRVFGKPISKEQAVGLARAYLALQHSHHEGS